MLSSKCFCSKKNKVPPSVPVTPTESSLGSPKETSQKTLSLKLLAGSTSTSHNEKSAERRQVSVKPTSKLPGTKRIEVKEAHVRTNLQSLMRITAMMEERKKTTLYGQEKKTTARKETTSNSLNMKNVERMQGSVRPTSKLPGTKRIEVQEAHVRTNFTSSVGTTAMRKQKEERTTTLYGQEKKTAARKETTSNRLNIKTAETKQVSVKPTSKLPGTKRIEVQEAHVMTNFKSSVWTTAMRKEKEEKTTTTLYGQEKKTAARKETTSNRLNMKTAETKQVSVKPTSKLPGTIRIEVKEANMRRNLQSPMRITVMMEERKKTTLYGQEKKTAARKEMTSNSLNMKKTETTQVSVRPTSKLPGSKHIEVQEAHVRTNFKSSVGTTAMRKEKEEKTTTTLYGQEKKTAARKETTSNRLNMKTAETKQVSVKPTSKLPGTKCIEVQEAHVMTNFKSSVWTTAMRKEKEEKTTTTLYGQEKKTAARKETTSNSLNMKNAERMQVSVRPTSKLPGSKRIEVQEAHVRTNFKSSVWTTAMRKEKEERTTTTLYGQEKKTAARKETTSNRLNMKTAETKQVSVKPTSKLPGTKRIEVQEAHVRTNLQSLMRITAMMEERKKTTLYGQEKKTTARKETTSNSLNMKNVERMQVSVRPTSKLPGSKRIEVQEAHVMTNFKSAVGTTAMRKEKEERKEMTLHCQGGKAAARKEERKETIPYNLENKMAKLNEELEELTFSSYMEYKKSVTDPYAFSSNKMIPEGNTKSPSLTPSEGNINSVTPSLTLSPITDKQQLTGGLPNFGYNCYANASLQCLFTASTFCRELSYLLDNSIHKLEDTFLRCFVELSRLRKSSEVRGDFGKNSLLLALIEASADINPEFTIHEQNDAHEFLCHCLTQMEESGQWLGWQEDADPRCPVRSNFKFKMRNIVTCSCRGSQQNNKVEVFNHISLPLVHNSVNQCLYDIVNNPTVVESKCKVCGGEFAISRRTFHTLPRFLILQLNRFKVTENYTVVKLETPVDIKPELQINCLPQSDMPRIENSKVEARETDRNELGGSTSTYRLISVLNHIGSTTFCGHYVCDCSSHNPHQWMTYNDELVTLTTETDVLQMRSTSAYVLLYERVHTG